LIDFTMFRSEHGPQNVQASLLAVSLLNMGSNHWARHLPFEQRHQREKWRLLETIV
jgi:hypothetical protein